MPIVRFHSAGQRHPEDVVTNFLVKASKIYARILECPVDRVRAFYVPHDNGMVATGGAAPGPSSVFFEFIVLEGRSLSQRQLIAREFTELISATLDVETPMIRGHCIRVEPEDWCIGGRFASDVRGAEIAQRKAQ